MSQLEVTFMPADETNPSWRHWQEIRHYGVWLRHIGDFHAAVLIGQIALNPWTKKERRRAKEISNRYFAHSEGAPGPNGTVKVVYSYKKKVEFFSLSSNEVTALRNEVLDLVSKQLEMDFEVSCCVCEEWSDRGFISCGHVDYRSINTEPPNLYIRPQNTKVTAVVYCKSDVSQGTNFTKSILLPTLTQGADITALAAPINRSIDTSKAWRRKDKICLLMHSEEDNFVGPIRELGFYTADGTLFMYVSASMTDA